MKPTPRSATDTPVSGFADEIKLCNKKLVRFVSGLTEEELRWTPPGIKNSISWILIHLTAELLGCYSFVTGIRMPFSPLTAGLAWGAVRGVEFDQDGRLPPHPIGDPTKHLFKAWEALRTVLEGAESNWEQRQVYADAKMRTAWWFLTHSLGDYAYHTGQASYLRKLIAAERKRSRKRRTP